MFPDIPLQEAKMTLKTYSGETLRVVGQRDVRVVIAGQTTKLPLTVVAVNDPARLGRNWLRIIHLDWQRICQVKQCKLSSVLDSYQTLFQPELGTIEGYEAKIVIVPEARPRICKAHFLPYTIRAQVVNKLDRLQADGIVKTVQFDDWAAPIVPVLKNDGKSIWISGDFKMTVNSAFKVDHYPIAKIEELFTKLAGGKVFSKLDISQTYQQIRLDEESRKMVVINTHLGLFQYRRLPFVVASAPGIFQKVMDCLHNGIPVVTLYLDDIHVMNKS